MSNKNGQIIDSWSCFSRLKPSLWPTFFGWHCLLTHRASHPAFSYHSIYISPYLPQKEQTECALYKGKMFHWKDRKTMWKKKIQEYTHSWHPVFLPYLFSETFALWTRHILLFFIPGMHLINKSWWFWDSIYHFLSKDFKHICSVHWHIHIWVLVFLPDLWHLLLTITGFLFHGTLIVFCCIWF